MLVAHLSDFHLDGTATTRDRLARVAAEVAASTIPIDLVLVTGDIVDRNAFRDAGAEAIRDEYQHVHDTLTPLGPVAYCPGNADGDVYDTFLRGMDVTPTGANYRLDTGGATFVLVDSRVPGELRGHLDDSTLAWLEATLAEVSTPVMIAFHHPAVEIGHPKFDVLRLDNADALEEIVRRHPRVLAILCGHTHSATAARFADRPLFIAPGVHSSGQLPWVRYAPDAGLIDPSAPPGFAMHRVDEDGITSFPVLLD